MARTKKQKVKLEAKNQLFEVEWHYTDGRVTNLRSPRFPQFEWVQGKFGLPVGPCFLDGCEATTGGVRHIYEYMEDVRLTVDRVLSEDGYTETYTLANVGKKPLTLKEGDYGAYVTLAEQYDIALVSLPRRAWTHIGHNCLYSVRCDGTAGGVGLVLTEGCMARIGEERPGRRQRGDLVAICPEMTLNPEETYRWVWKVFAYENEEEFLRVVRPYAKQWQICPLSPRLGEKVQVLVDGETVEFVHNGNKKCGFFPAEVNNQVCIDGYEMTIAGRGGEVYQAQPDGSRAATLLAEADLLLHVFLVDKQEETYQKAVKALLGYYRWGGTRRLDFGVPLPLLKHSEPLRTLFAKQAKRALADKKILSRNNVLGQADVLVKAAALWGGVYAEAASLAAIRAKTLIQTPFGPLFTLPAEWNDYLK